MSDKPEEKKEESKAPEGKEESKQGEAGAAGGSGGTGEMEGAKFKTVIDTVTKIEKISLNSEDERRELEQMRRWKVDISEIYITSQEMFDCFLRFTIGGNLQVSCYSIPSKNKKGKIIKGKRGYSDYTEVMEILQTDKRIKFKKNFRLEYRDSIISLMKQNLLVECWDYNSIKLNSLQGYEMVSLMKIIRGSIYQSVMISKKIKEGNFMKLICKIEFKIVFQEIWDFQLTFEDWSCTNIKEIFKEKDVNLCPGVSFQIQGKQKEVSSGNGQPGSQNPDWGSLAEKYPIRATINDLENLLMNVTIDANTSSLLFLNSVKKTYTVDLKGVTVNGQIKQYLTRTSTLAGKVNINLIPKFKQIGFQSIIDPNSIYIMIDVLKLTINQPPSFCKLPVNVFLTVEFSGKTFETIRIPIQYQEKKFNQSICFHFGVNSECVDDPVELRLKEIINRLELVNEVCVNLWIEDSYRCLDYLGTFNILLTDIFEKGKIKEKKYRKDENTEIPYMPKVFNGEDLFESPYMRDYVRLKYEVWLYPDEFTKSIELSKDHKALIQNKKGDNPIIEKVKEILDGVKDLYNQHIRNLNSKYGDFPDNKRFFEFFVKEEDTDQKDLFFRMLDQNGNPRILNSFLSKLTIQELDVDEEFLGFNVENMFKKKAQIAKIQLPIRNLQGLLHYTKCIRFVYLQNLEHVFMSPDFFMQTRKGTKYEHVMYLACLMMNMNSKINKLDEDDELKDRIHEKLEKNPQLLLELQQKKEKDLETQNLLKLDESKQNTTTISKLELKDLTDRSQDAILLNKEGEDKEKKIPKKPPVTETHNPVWKKLELEVIKECGGKKPQVKIDTSDLVFVCWGTLKGDTSSFNTKHFWIMTIEKNFEDITFWEPMSCKKYVLKNRVRYPKILKKYMKGDFSKEKEIIKELNQLTKKQSGEENTKSNQNKTNKNKRGNMARILNGDEDIDLNLITQKTSDIMKEMDYMDIHVDLKKGLRYGGQEIKDFSTEDEYFRTHNLVKKTKGKETDIRKDQGTTAMLDFLWKDDYDDNDVKNEVLPYRTLDIIFNKKNIFVNIQNPNPAGIEYDLYDKAKWFSVLKKRDASNDLEDEIWKQDIPAFYAFKNFLPPYTDEEIELMKKSILSSLTHTIRNVRIQKNLNSFFKSTREIRDMFELYTIFLELKELGLTSKQDHKKRMTNWHHYFREKMPNKTTISIFPLFFNYANETLISNYIEENCQEFINNSTKDTYFILTCKIFQYPNRILSVRIIVSLFYKKSDPGNWEEIDDDLFQTEMAEDDAKENLIEEKGETKANSDILVEEKK